MGMKVDSRGKSMRFHPLALFTALDVTANVLLHARPPIGTFVKFKRSMGSGVSSGGGVMMESNDVGAESGSIRNIQSSVVDDNVVGLLESGLLCVDKSLYGFFYTTSSVFNMLKDQFSFGECGGRYLSDK